MHQIAASPFEKASKLWGAPSSPPGSLYGSAFPVTPVTAAEDGLREKYASPEAVEGFLLHAYRPASLPLAMHSGQLSDDEDDGNHELLAPQSSALKCAPRLWADHEDCAVSITSSPRLQRTDVPITKFLPPRNMQVAAARRLSMDEQMNSSRISIELKARSSSVPTYSETLSVEDLWAKLPAAPAFNPFDNTPDTDGLFRD